MGLNATQDYKHILIPYRKHPVTIMNLLKI